MGKLIPAHCQCHCAGWLACCISHRRQRRPMGWTVCIAGRLFNGLTANDCWHRIYQSQQHSLSLVKGLMLAETVAQTDAAWHRQTLPIISIWFLRLSLCLCCCAFGCQHLTLNRLFGCVFLVWRHHLRKVNKSSVRTFRRFFFYSFLIFWCSSIFK